MWLYQFHLDACKTSGNICGLGLRFQMTQIESTVKEPLYNHKLYNLKYCNILLFQRTKRKLYWNN